MNKTILILGSLFGLLTVAMGAFGAHAFEELLQNNGRVDTFETAVKYQAMHAVVLLFLGMLMDKLDSKLLRYAAWFMVVGIVIFSGSLYILSLANLPIMGAITPIGGMCFIVGWVLLLLQFTKLK
ncbi:MAG: DUF423 domain-containing protein [Cyclobacteriaceae bacterium]